jgi:hypothetical protein
MHAMHPDIISAFHRTVSLRRDEVFEDDRLMPQCSVADASIAAPGWVGEDWQPGCTLLVAINPGGGGDRYRINPTDVRLYDLVRAFRRAEELASQSAALRALSDAWLQIQSTHSINRVMTAVLAATGGTIQSSAFLNVLPFRTREDKPARKSELRNAWEKGASHQVRALAPARIVALGCKAHDALLAAGADRHHKIILIKRAIGDNSLPPHALATLEQLKAERAA